MNDALVWSELGSIWPDSGGSFVYLRELTDQTLGDVSVLLFLFGKLWFQDLWKPPLDSLLPPSTSLTLTKRTLTFTTVVLRSECASPLFGLFIEKSMKLVLLL